MHFLVYLSKHTQGADKVASSLKDIVNASKANNKSLGVTGALFHHQGTFLQAIEGEQEMIYQLLERISKDHRHDNVKVILDESIERRRFGDWNMDSFNLDNTHAADTDALIRFKKYCQAELPMDKDTFVDVLLLVMRDADLLGVSRG